MNTSNITPNLLRRADPLLNTDETAPDTGLTVCHVSNPQGNTEVLCTLSPWEGRSESANPPQGRSALNTPITPVQSALPTVPEEEAETSGVQTPEETDNRGYFPRLLRALRSWGDASRGGNNQPESTGKGYFASATSQLTTDVNMGSGLKASASSGVELKVSDLVIQERGGEERGRLALVELSNSTNIQVGGVDLAYLPQLSFSNNTRTFEPDASNSTTTEPRNSTESSNGTIVLRDSFEYRTTDNGTIYSSGGTTLVTPTEAAPTQAHNQTLTISNHTLSGFESGTASNDSRSANNQSDANAGQTPLNDQAETNSTRSALNTQLPIESTSLIGSLLPRVNVSHRSGLRGEFFSQAVTNIDSMRMSAFTEMRFSIGLAQLITRIYQRLGMRAADFNLGSPHFYTSNQMQQQTSASVGMRTLYLWDSTEGDPYRALNISMLLQGAQLFGQGAGWLLGNLVLSPIAGMSLGGLLSSWSSVTLMRWSPFAYFRPSRDYTTGINMLDVDVNILDLSGRQYFTMINSVGGHLRAGILQQHDVGLLDPTLRNPSETTAPLPSSSVNAAGGIDPQALRNALASQIQRETTTEINREYREITGEVPNTPEGLDPNTLDKDDEEEDVFADALDTSDSDFS